MRAGTISALWLIPLLTTLLPAGEREHFETRVRPLLAKNCYACHRQSAMGGLRLDSRELILKGGSSGPAVVPGEPDRSLLLQAVNHSHDRLKMPPSGKLPDTAIADLALWIKGGAYWPPEQPATVPATPSNEYVITPEQRAFWSFQPVRTPELPTLQDSTGVLSPIDRFIRAQWEAKGLKPAPPAGKRTLIRRATLALTGLPPTPAEVSAFLADSAPDAFAKVVDRLLASPRYGETWGRHWLDVARYADDKLDSERDKPYPNSWRYRDWVVRAFNEDMPYDQFVKAQIAGDLMQADDPQRYRPGLGLYALSPEFQDDRVDVTTRGFLGLTVACATCHDHKFDPIPTKDFYSLQGIFNASKVDEYPLADQATVAAYQQQKKRLEEHETAVKRFYATEQAQLGEVLAAQTANYLLATRGLADESGLDAETLQRWRTYLARPEHDHPYLKPWRELTAKNAGPEELRAEAARIQQLILTIIDEKRVVDEKNKITLGLDPSRNDLSQATLVSLERNKYAFWNELFSAAHKDAAGIIQYPDGVFFYGQGKIERFFSPLWRAHAEQLKAQLASLKKALPAQYPFIHSLTEGDKPEDGRIYVRGDKNNLGDVAPRRFLAILSGEQRPLFRQGSGRLQLAEAIANKDNPLTARVIVNRVWHHHFGRGIVATTSNFGQLGERPTHPELLDWLTARFMEQGWSLKQLHRDIMLSATYQLSAADVKENAAIDPDNRLLWRTQRRRLDVEQMRDSILFVAGTLDTTMGGDAIKLDDDNRRRTLYARISRRKLDPLLSLFDFPNPNGTAEVRTPTNVPPQRLFFLNSPFVQKQAEALAARLTGDEPARVTQAYQLLYGRAPDVTELAIARDFLQNGSWTQYCRTLLGSNEFLFVE